MHDRKQHYTVAILQDDYYTVYTFASAEQA